MILKVVKKKKRPVIEDIQNDLTAEPVEESQPSKPKNGGQGEKKVGVFGTALPMYLSVQVFFVKALYLATAGWIRDRKKKEDLGERDGKRR